MRAMLNAGELNERQVELTIEHRATPVMVGGVLYTSGVAGRAYAYDAATGRELWHFEPDVDMQVNRWVCCDMANRGVAVADGLVYVGYAVTSASKTAISHT